MGQGVENLATSTLFNGFWLLGGMAWVELSSQFAVDNGKALLISGGIRNSISRCACMSKRLHAPEHPCLVRIG
jgi:hypothetical protein